MTEYGKGWYHEVWCQHKKDNHMQSMDASKRIADEYMMHRAASVAAGIDAMGKFIACALEDGTSDHVLYNTHDDAVKHQGHNSDRRVYIRLMAPTMNACEAFVMLKTARAAYNNGLRLTDPGKKRGSRAIIRRVSIEDALAASNGMPTNLRFDNGRYN